MFHWLKHLFIPDDDEAPCTVCGSFTKLADMIEKTDAAGVKYLYCKRPICSGTAA